MNPNGRATGGASYLRRLVACSALIVGAVGCAPSSVSDGSASLPGASPRESAAASPAVTGEPSPSARTPDAATPSPESALANDAIGRVIVTDLVTRSAPGVGEDSRILEMGLTDGDLVYVIAGPVPADGYEWLLVAELAPRFSSQAAGWIAPASREGETWLEPVQPACPTDISVAAFAVASPPLLLKCFGGQELSLEGVFGSCAHGDPVIQEPAWLANHFCSFEVTGRGRTSDWPSISVHTQPGVMDGVAAGESQPMRITGRFDSPVADTCRFTDEATQIMPELGETDDLFLRFNCRAAFVVESATPVP